LEEVSVSVTVGAESGRRDIQGPADGNRTSSFQGMSEREVGLQELYPELIEGESLEEGRSRQERMDGRAEIVMEARQREFLGPHPPADGCRLLEHDDRVPGSCHLDRGSKTVGTRPHDDEIGSRR
jgi:hypothetical protein